MPLAYAAMLPHSEPREVSSEAGLPLYSWPR